MQDPIFFSISSEQRDAFANGSMWIAPMFDSQAHLLAESGMNVGFAYPQEGGFVTHNMINIVKGPPDREAAEAFIDYFLDADVQARWATAVRYGPTNKNAKLDPEVAEQVVYGPEQVTSMMYVDWDTINQNRAEWNDRWNREILG